MVKWLNKSLFFLYHSCSGLPCLQKWD